ncbi:MAG: nuclear transport factor 2 family protein [Salinimicrobium sp.]
MSDKENFLRKVNKAFVEGNRQFLLEAISEDICWDIVGEKMVSGKMEFSDALEKMQEMPPIKIDIQKVVIQENSAVVTGIVIGRNHVGQKKNFGFCDIYELAGSKDLKIDKMTSYVIDISKYKQYRETC